MAVANLRHGENTLSLLRLGLVVVPARGLSERDQSSGHEGEVQYRCGRRGSPKPDWPKDEGGGGEA